ncbi:MAG: Zn-dependent alcohol dehydrogenase, partial [Actinomyces sp.]
MRVSGGRPVLATEPVPAAGDDEVLVRVASAGVCGSDLHLLDAGFLEGRIPGHEIAGHTPDGTPVAVEPLVSCGVCAACRSGARNRCERHTAPLGIELDGGMADALVVPAAALVPLPAGVSPHDACLVEPLAVAVHGLERVRPAPGERLLVIGGGPIGLAVAAVAVAAGLAVDLVGRHAHQREAAERLGARAEESGAPDGFDAYPVVVDAVGSSASLAEAVRRVRPEGRIGIVGIFWEPVRLDISVCMKEVELVPSMMYGCTARGRDIDAAAGLLARHPEWASALVTHRLPLDA